jgi:hypothetical protein
MVLSIQIDLQTNYVDLRNIHKLVFDEFCTKIVSNLDVKTQLYS